MDRGGVTRHHIGPVEEVGDAAETLGLALGTEIAAGGVQTGQFGVVLWADTRRDAQLETVRDPMDGQAVCVCPIFGTGQSPLVQMQGFQFQPLAVQQQRHFRRRAGGTLQRQSGDDARGLLAQFEIEFHPFDSEIRGAVVAQTDTGGVLGIGCEIHVCLGWRGGPMIIRNPRTDC
jgi:hypothetical protein